MNTDFSVGKFKRPTTPLFHPESMLARKPWLTRGHRHMPLVMKNPVVFYVLYENPADYPCKFVLRRWCDQTPDRSPVCVATNLTDALSKLPKNVRCIGRNFGDTACIKDVWTEVAPTGNGELMPPGRF